jgi:rod shape-determining protein MreB and related proteins
MVLEFFQSKDIAIDLGTANTLIYVCGQGIVLDEPSVVAIRKQEGPKVKRKLHAAGQMAKAMQGKEPVNLQTVRPMKDGVITDLAITEQMLNAFVRKAMPGRRLFRSAPRIVIGVPSACTQIERRAIHQTALTTGAKEVYLLEDAMAAAIGAGLPVHEATGSMVVDIGGGTTAVAIISLGGMVYKESVRVGGDKLDEAIMAYVRKKHGVVIGEPTAENIKNTVGSALASDEPREMEFQGHNIAMAGQQCLRINSNEVFEAMSEPLGQIVKAIKKGLENAPPELGADIANMGMVLTGGGALLHGLDQLLSAETGVPVFIAPDPQACVAKGCGMAVERLDESVSLFI